VKRGDIKGRIDPIYLGANANIPGTASFPAHFPVVRLRDLAKNVSQPVEFIREYVEDGPDAVAFLRAANLEDGNLNLDDVVFVDREKLGKGMESLINAGDLLITRTGAKAGATCIVPPLKREYAVSSHSIRIPLKTDRVVPAFLEAFLLSRWGKAQINRLFTGAAQKQLQLSTVSEISIVLPPHRQQAEIVTTMKAARAKQQARLAEADALLTSFDGYLLDTLGLTPPPRIARKAYAVRFLEITGTRFDAQYHQPHYAKVTAALAACRYHRVSLGVLSPEIVGGATPTRGDQDLYAASGIRFLRILNVKPNEIAEEDMKFIQEHVHEVDLKRSQLAPNDILMSITGRVGTAAVVPAEILPANINQHIVRLRISTDDCLPAYLAAFLNSTFGLSLSNRGVTGGTRIALDYGAVRALQIPLPPMQLQNEIVAELDRRREQARRLRAEAEDGWGAAKRWFEEQLLGPAQPSVTPAMPQR